ncbi:MAG: fibronectin type III domain-containing protein [DPANN group archaeon]|nr:fibronectin type III domain-containing protein [DPANN group archaeon]
MSFNRFPKVLFVIISILYCFSGLVSATADVTYTFNQNNVNVLAYDCLEASCINHNAFSGIIPSYSTTNGQLIIKYPAQLTTTFGYAIFFTSPGQVPLEYKVFNQCSGGGTQCSGTISKTLYQLSDCSSTVDSFTVTNDEHAEVPIVINTQSSLDATTYSAFQDADTGVGFTPDSLKDDYYSSDIHVKLEIKKGTSLVYTSNKYYTKSSGDDGPPLYMDTAQDVEFTWTPTTDGTYTATITTNVIDDVCINSIAQSATDIFSVLPRLPRNECYTILNDLTIVNPYPIVGFQQIFNFSKISNYANNYQYDDSNYVLTPIPTAITYDIKKESGTLVELQTYLADANNDNFTAEYNGFNWVPETAGSYNISITGLANSTLCSGLDNTPNYLSMFITVDPKPVYSVTFTESSSLIGVSITMDGETGVTDSSGQLTLTGFQSGTYTYTASKSAYDTKTGNVEIIDKSKDIEFTMLVTNTAPSVMDLPDKTLVQSTSDSTIDLDDYVLDSTDAKSTLTWSYSGNSNVGVSINPTTHILILSAPPSWTGIEDITFTATDPHGLSGSDTLRVNVTHLNTPPSISIIPNISTDEDIPKFDVFNLNSYVTDTETLDVNLIYTITGNTNTNVGFSIDSSKNIDIQPALNWFGFSTITIKVTDEGGLTASQSFIITVNPINDVPEITGVPSDFAVTQDTTYLFDLTAYKYDIEDSAATLIWTINNVNTYLYTASINASDILNITPKSGMIGSDVATLVLTDSGLLQATKDITINISALPNTAPSISGLPDVELDEDGFKENAFNLNTYANDTQTSNDNLRYSIIFTDLYVNVTIDSNNNIDVYPTEDWNGLSIVTIEVTDEGGLTDTDMFTVTVNSINDAPVATGVLPNLIIGESLSDSSIDLDNYFTDVDGDVLSYSSTTPSHATVYIDPFTNVVTFTALSGWIGDENITFIANDSILTASSTMTLTIIPLSATYPVINSITIDDSIVSPLETIHVTVNVTDDSGIFSVEAESVLLSNTIGNIWEGDIIANSAPGVYTINVTVVDTSSNVVTDISVSYSVILDSIIPFAPSNPVAIAIDNETIRLNWIFSMSDDVEKYNIYYSLFSGGQDFSVPNLVVSNATNLVNITGLNPLTKYFFVVEASDYVDNINRSIETSAITLATGQDIDPDGDGLPTGWENHYNQTGNILDPNNNDSDNNGILDGDEDPDNDGLTNYEEYLLGTNPNNPDSDNDGIPDGWEITYNMNPTDPKDATYDNDGDGLSNLYEYLENPYRTNPNLADSDGDGIDDGTEIANGSNPLDINSPTCHVGCGSSNGGSYSSGSWPRIDDDSNESNETLETQSVILLGFSSFKIPINVVVGDVITFSGCFVNTENLTDDNRVELYIDNIFVDVTDLDNDMCFELSYFGDLSVGLHESLILVSGTDFNETQMFIVYGGVTLEKIVTESVIIVNHQTELGVGISVDIAGFVDVMLFIDDELISKEKIYVMDKEIIYFNHTFDDVGNYNIAFIATLSKTSDKLATEILVINALPTGFSFSEHAEDVTNIILILLIIGVYIKRAALRAIFGV